VFYELTPHSNATSYADAARRHRSRGSETRFDERGGIISPDSRWLAYEADNSGRYEIYVRPFPSVNAGSWQVSTGGGAQPLWAHSGQELFYVAPDGALMAVAVQARGSVWATQTPRRLFGGPYYVGGGINSIRHYDITADDRRFLMLKEAADDANTAQIIVVQNWFEELKRLAPTN
jgi:serine/threonine-protein kinase